MVKESGAELSKEEIIEYAATRLAKFQKPRWVVFLDVLPKNPLGTVPKKGILGEVRKATRPLERWATPLMTCHTVAPPIRNEESNGPQRMRRSSVKRYNTILVEKKDTVGIITMNRPEKLNAMNLEMKNEIADALSSLEKDDEVKAVILTGAGRAFSSGHDNDDPLENML